MTRIFISYRRDDTGGYAGRLYDQLVTHFDEEHVFMDIDTIEPGLDFVEVIETAVGNCDVVLALIGKQWLTINDAYGQRRLDSPEDFVRLEIAAALERNIRVIPVLVQGTSMPRANDLPEVLTKLARRHAFELSDVRWKYDVGRLIEVLEKIMQSISLQATTTPPTTNPQPSGTPRRTISKELLEILSCPVDKGPVELMADAQGHEWLVNRRNGYRYPVEDGVPIMLIEEGEKNRDPGLIQR